VVAPVGHRVKLQAVRELHLVGFAKLLKLLAPFAVSFARYGRGRMGPGLLWWVGAMGTDGVIGGQVRLRQAEKDNGWGLVGRLGLVYVGGRRTKPTKPTPGCGPLEPRR
jgi:hypothetical protein